MSGATNRGVPIRSALECLQKDVLKDQRRDSTDLDCTTTDHKHRDPPSRDRPPKITEYPLLREALRVYFREEGQEDILPSLRTVVDIMAAAGGATEREVIACLRYLYQERGLRPGTMGGPRHWSWFKTVVRDYFEQERAHREALTRKHAMPCTMPDGRSAD